MAQKIVLYESKLTISIVDHKADLTDADLEKLTEAIEDEIDMGLAAVGKSIVGKIGGGRLIYKVG